jgi:hypothetical protein
MGCKHFGRVSRPVELGINIRDPNINKKASMNQNVATVFVAIVAKEALD